MVVTGQAGGCGTYSGVTYGGRSSRTGEEAEREDADTREERKARELEGMPEQGKACVGSAVRVDRVRHGMGGVPAEQLEVSRSAGVPGESWSAGRGDFLFCGDGGPIEAETLSGVAGDQFGARKRRKRRANGGTARVERGRSGAGGGGFIVSVSARSAIEEGKPGASEL
jgi:hypothetical protein